MNLPSRLKLLLRSPSLGSTVLVAVSRTGRALEGLRRSWPGLERQWYLIQPPSLVCSWAYTCLISKAAGFPGQTAARQSLDRRGWGRGHCWLFTVSTESPRIEAQS